MIEGNLCISHPCYTKKGFGYACAYFRWHGFDDPIAARTMMIMDLSDCEILSYMDQDPDTVLDNNHLRIKSHLTQEKWLILLASESP